jgi:2-phospho-L-lactate transferase/gluconeogenesis factor (CofD/UPF0052 family)
MKNHLFSETSAGLNLVAIGGGNGLSMLLSGLKKFVAAREISSVWLENLSAIVAVSDDGGSSGRLRDELQMLPPGDIRNCMVALSEDSYLLSKLFKYRFRGDGELGGHSFGNLFLAALTEITGDFAEAVRLSSEILPLLVDDVSGAIADSPAVKIFICNLMTQPGETEGFSAKKHLEIVRQYAPEIDFDYVIINNCPISKEQAARYESEGATQIGVSNSISPETVEGVEIVYDNLLDEGEKVRHHPEKLARVVLLCAAQTKNLLVGSE